MGPALPKPNQASDEKLTLGSSPVSATGSLHYAFDSPGFSVNLTSTPQGAFEEASEIRSEQIRNPRTDSEPGFPVHARGLIDRLNKKPRKISGGFASLNRLVQGSFRDRVRTQLSRFWFRDEARTAFRYSVRTTGELVVYDRSCCYDLACSTTNPGQAFFLKGVARSNLLVSIYSN